MLANPDMNMALMPVMMAAAHAPASQPAVRLELGARAARNDQGASIAHLRAALAGPLDIDQRFRAATLLAGLLAQALRAPEAADLLEQQLPSFDGRPDLQQAVEVSLATLTRTDPTTRHRGRAVLERLKHRVQERGERDPAAVGTVAAELAIAGESAAATAELADRAVHGSASYDALYALIVAEHYEPALRVLTGARDRDLLVLRSALNQRTGEPVAAESDARGALARSAGWPLAEERASAALAEALIDRGALDEADRCVNDARFTGPELMLARGRLRHAQGRTDEAIDALFECGRLAIGLDVANPAVLPWRSQLAHALLDRGRVTEAKLLAAEELERARRFGAPRAIGVALRASARAAGGADEIALLREAVALLGGARLEQARARTDLGMALRRAGLDIEARDPLRLAVDVAHRCGAAHLEERALAELRATGARPRRRLTSGAGALTPSERRIADLAAAGNLNREIAEILVVTMATVEYHLRNAYRKLGITSRRQLPAAL